MRLSSDSVLNSSCWVTAKRRWSGLTVTRRFEHHAPLVSPHWRDADKTFTLCSLAMKLEPLRRSRFRLVWKDVSAFRSSAVLSPSVCSQRPHVCVPFITDKEERKTERKRREEIMQCMTDLAFNSTHHVDQILPHSPNVSPCVYTWRCFVFKLYHASLRQ